MPASSCPQKARPVRAEAGQKAIGAEQTGTRSAATEKKMRSWQAARGVDDRDVELRTWRAPEKALAP
ncbi:MAG: hypothetical protein ACRYG2_13365 [Janthinobacterium lividum]